MSTTDSIRSTFVVALLSLQCTQLGCAQLNPQYPVCYFSVPGGVVEWTDANCTNFFKSDGRHLVLAEKQNGLFLPLPDGSRIAVSWPRSVPLDRMSVHGLSSLENPTMVLRDSKDPEGATYILQSNGKSALVPERYSNGLEAVLDLPAKRLYVYRDHIVWVSGSTQNSFRIQTVPGTPGPVTVSSASNSFVVTSNEKAIEFDFQGKKIRSWVLPDDSMYVGFSHKFKKFYTLETFGTVWLSDGAQKEVTEQTRVLRGGVTDELTFGVGRGFGLEYEFFALQE